MASSQIEIASSSPFGCVLRDHTLKERRREINVRAVLDLDTNFKDLVRDCISQNQITPVTMTKEQGNIRNLRNLRLLNNHTTNQKPSLVLDGRVTRQAQDVAIDRHAINEATDPLLVASNSKTAPPTPSCRNLGASSLVQIWEARVSRSNSINSNLFQDADASRTNSNENIASPVEEPSTLDEKINKRRNNEDASIDGDTRAAGEAPSCSSSSDAGERERVRIADIIKKLKHADDREHSNRVTDPQFREHKRSSTSDQGQAAQRCFLQVVKSPRLRGRQAFRDLLKQIVRDKHSNSVIDSPRQHKHSSTSFLNVVNSPRIRGRQAFRDLLMRIERDKKRELESLLERQSVSKFSQRGRLQSMLRLRSLQRSQTIQDKCRPRTTGAQGTRFSQGSTMMQLRGKFSPGAEHNDSVTSRCLKRDQILNNSTQLDKSSASKLQSEDQKASIAGHQSIWPVNRVTACRNENLNEQAKPPSHAIEQKETSSKARCLGSLKTADATAALEGQPENQMVKKQGSNFQHLFLDSKETAETISSLNVDTQNDGAEEQSNLRKHLSLDLQETKDTTISLNSSTENKIGEEREQDIDDQHHLCLETKDTAISLNSSTENKIVEEREQDIDDQHHLCLDSEEIVENTKSCGDRDDNEAIEQSNHRKHLSLDLQETKDTAISLNSSTENKIVEERDQDIDDQHHLCLDSEEIVENTKSCGYRDDNEAIEQSNHRKHLSLDLQETKDTAISLNSSTENKIVEERDQDIDDQHHLCLDSEEIVENTKSCSDGDDNEATEQSNHQKHLPLDLQETKDTTISLNSSIENKIGEEREQDIDDQHHLCLDSEEIVENTKYCSDRDDNEATEQSNHRKHPSLDLQETKDTTISLNSSTENKIGEEREQDIDDQHHLCLDSEEIVENTTSCSDRDDNEATEELDDHYSEYLDQTDYDWFSSISRPRSYWEDLRKAWYHEVLNNTSKNEEIRQLVERGRVSTCLASDIRERIDRLMISRVQIMQEDGAASQKEVDDEDRMVQVKSYLQRHLHPAGGQGGEEEEAMSINSHQSLEANNYFNQSSPSSQMPSPSDLTRSWSSQDDKETGNDSDRGPSAFSPPPGASEVQYYQDTRRSSSSISPTSLEMELICDLRGHIEQLQREMSELRKSIMSCMDMQMKWQQYSFNRELLHSGGREESKSTERAASPRKRTCCKCLEMQIDSLLYRCGHICTCLKCAHELQWSSGTCPICAAPILDVVPIK
ncbi:hypothetical protein HRI_004927800 [Hibiscus trionum]|uniref:RING-type domain-containing protein n=1 Tax=Hibiscus trionum TaxID=183268 RepID=A0A9W7JDI7_HIBTR|nr:hypothetical protein HRI_004927800 [Hibiscus trionum]